jgi:hypothetical protein
MKKRIALKRLLFLLPMLPAAFIPATAQPNPPLCTEQSLVGTYSVSYAGWLTAETTPAYYSTILGVVSIFGDGTVSGSGAVSGMGPVTDYSISGTVDFHSDCVGTLTFPGTEIDRFIFIKGTGGNPDKMMVTISELAVPGIYPSALGTWTKISSKPGVMTWENERE